MNMGRYITIKELSEKRGIGLRRINTLCNEGPIDGTSKKGNIWIIPADAKKPKDESIKSGKYVKSK